MNSRLLIYNDNVSFFKKFNSKIAFKPTADIDEYITKNIIPQLKTSKAKIIYIKDNLSSNYLELYGLRLIYHIRLSQELGNKRFLPIVLLSDLDTYLLNRLTPMAKVLFTKNIFVAPNSIESLGKIEIKEFKEEEFERKFLNLIEVEAPKDYLSHHDISNEWAIYRWAEFLKINDSQAINQNREKIASMLYFKYLLARNPITIKKKNGIQFVPRPPENSGKILYIDDEWAKGWSDIFKHYFSKNKNIEFETLEYNFKDSNKFKIISDIDKRVKSYNPDLVLLDLRLTQSDHKSKEIDDFTGIKVIKIIKEINPAIQVVILSATGKSLILEKLYRYNILGYIKKEHPTDNSIDTKESFEHLKELIDTGLGKKYLKEIWNIQNRILDLELFEKENFKQMRFEIGSVFEILDSNINMQKRYIYAMLSIHQCLEEINNCYIDDKRAVWIDTQKPINVKNSTKNKILEVLTKRLRLYGFEEKINEIAHLRNGVIHPNGREINIRSEQILDWFEMLENILKKVSSDQPNH